MKKFRVWHKTLERFLTKEEWFLNLDGELYFLNIIDIESTNMLKVPNDVYVVQQFTEEQDKNGKDIWEGDIVIWDGWGEEYKTEIIFSGGSFLFDDSPIGDYFRELEIIGNIFENPELIK